MAATECNIKNLFFPVELRPIYWRRSLGLFADESSPTDWEYFNLERFSAVFDTQADFAFSVVTNDSYCLISNETAYNLGIDVAKYVFSIEGKEDFISKGYITPNKAACHMWIMRRIEQNQPEILRGWKAAVYVENSYNKTRAFKVSAGFRNDIYNADFLIKSIAPDLKVPHDSAPDEIKQLIFSVEGFKKVKYSALEKEFQAKIVKLKSLRIAKMDVLPLGCKYFNLIKKPGMNKSKLEKLADSLSQLYQLIPEHFKSSNGSGYDLLELFMHYNNEMSLLNNELKGTLGHLGTWTEDFIKQASNPDYQVTEFAKKEAIDTASWFERTHVNGNSW